MSFDIRLPQINAPTEKEQLAQIKSYLFQLAEQLQWGLQNIESSSKSSNVVVTPTPRSLLAGSQPAQSPEATFGSIKALIIKSADIINAYYEDIHERLEGQYVAQSDFGTFKENTAQDITKSATRIDNAFINIQSIETNLIDVDESVEEVRTGIDSNLQVLNEEISELNMALNDAKGSIDSDIQGIRDEIENIEFSLVEVNANIRSGLLYYDDDEIPVYGLEIGQKTMVDGEEVFNKFARFTSERLSFYDRNGIEVAYISDYRLYIYNVEITGIFKIGGLVDTVMASGDVVTKWVQGG